MTLRYETDVRGMRKGVLETRRGEVPTPFFMPDATRASVRGLTTDQLRNAGVHPMVVNTYHLMLQPGADFLHKHGGVHRFMDWDGPLLSDSGGYQVYSLIHKNPKLGRITEEGAQFRSVLDGSKHLLTPEKAMQIQFSIGTDMMVVLDDPRPPQAKYSVHEAAVERTLRWAQLCMNEFTKQCDERDLTNATRPLLFCVVQGGPYVELRERCAHGLTMITGERRDGTKQEWDGYGFGGRHIDSEGVFMDDIISATAAAIPENKARFALGIGNPGDIVRCYSHGWDMFDCVIPTREGRHGRIFTWTNRQADLLSGEAFYETINIMNATHLDDFGPLDASCSCYACTHYSRAYLKHLFRVNEPLGAQMASLHNLQFYNDVMGGLVGKT